MFPKRLKVILNHCPDCFDALGYPHIRQEYQSRVRDLPEVDQLPEVLVQRDENPVLQSRPFQQRPVSGVWAKGLGFNNIVPVLA